ncbi:hypothetical protein Tco_1529501 [Tanacetum coccineum]
MAEMFRLLKDLTISRTPKKVLVREKARNPITKCVNAISLVKMKKDKNIKNNKVVDKSIIEASELNIVELIELVGKEEYIEDGTDYELVMSMKEELDRGEIKAEYNESLLATHLGKMDYETYNSLPAGPMYNEILKKKLAKKDDMGVIIKQRVKFNQKTRILELKQRNHEE